MNHDDDFEPYARARRQKRPRTSHAPLAAPADERSTFAASVQVTKAERAWIREHLEPFRDSCLLEDVLLRIKAGKEATVYACAGHASQGQAVIAAKLYRARSLRGEQNASRYQQGRDVLTGDGGVARARAWRLHKAIAQKSAKGLSLSQASWLLHEFQMLSALHAHGANVPRPIAHNEHALLMEFIGDGVESAPTLNEVVLEPRAAARLLEQIVFDVELLLELGAVHGDLSAYNILYQSERAVLIDFPQVVDARGNPEARALLERDLERLGQYFARAGAPLEHRSLAAALWTKHGLDADPEQDPRNGPAGSAG